MEYIKKEIKLLTITGSTGVDNEYIIVPDESINYNFKIKLKSKSINYGYFGAVNYD
jgi:hypothetical protein